MATRFYRLETVHGRGIYQTLFSDEIYGATNSESYSELHPPPAHDKILVNFWGRAYPHVRGSLGSDALNYIFGFYSLAQLRAWFPPNLIQNIVNSTRVKIVLSVYHSSDIIKGDRQSMMRKDSGELVKQLNLKILLAKSNVAKKSVDSV